MFKNKSFQFRLLALTGAIIFVLTTVFAYVLQSATHEAERNTLDSLVDAAVSTSDAVAAQFFERYGDVQAFAVNPVITEGKLEERIEMLNTYVALYGIYDLIILTDANGKIVAVNEKDAAGGEIRSKELLGRNVSNQEWFKAVIAGKFTEDKENGFAGTYVEDAHVDELVSAVYGGSRFGNSFSAAFKDKSGKVIGVISNRANAKWYEEAIENTFRSLQSNGFRRPTLSILNRQGVVIANAHPGEKNELIISHESSLILKFNYVDANFSGALELKKSGKSGNSIGSAPDSKEEVASGFSPVNHKKFVKGLGWGVVIYGPISDLLEEEFALKRNSYLVLLLITVAMLGLMFAFARNLSNQLRKISGTLAAESGEVNQLAGVLSGTSDSLSSSTSEQAAALQETVSSIDEVSAMTQKNAENAKRSNEVAQASSQTAERGQRAVEEMNRSIESIQKSNADIMAQVDQGNQKLAEIVKVINEIGSKTKVINDIVFQTKLLSFNASVEAARAGEHGKGFAVVAEEVGNLAQMSGNAAKDITQLLESSVQQVERIVGETRTGVERMMAASREKLAEGAKTAKDCGSILEEVVQRAGEVGGLVSEISTASDEQSRGVQEINKAMNQITQTNSAAARDASGMSSKLRNQGERLQGAVHLLTYLVEGQATQKSPEPPRAEGPLAKVIPVPLKNKKVTAEPSVARKDGTTGQAVPSREDARFEEV